MPLTLKMPTVLIVFGATGDLMQKKIIPALFYLYSSVRAHPVSASAAAAPTDALLPGVFTIIAYSRRELTDESYRQFTAQALSQYYQGEVTPEQKTAFLSLFRYQQGTFENLADYRALGERLGNIDGEWQACSNKLFYLSVPPAHYAEIFEHLKESRLTDPCSPEEGWTRVLVEKPFGKDMATAKQLDNRLAELFKEEQIYRIDHYLAKEMLQNILAFRFSNSLFEQAWSNQFIERIDIRLLESLGVEDRGTFYDGVGALRDVGQNHLLQMLALVTMDHPRSYEASAIRAKRAEALKQIEIMSPTIVPSRTFRAQYEGYQTIKGVKPDSTTETYFKMITSLNSPRWAGVPIILESGKRMGKALKEIAVSYKHPMPCLCPPELGHHYQNKIIFQLEPSEGITINFWTKKPGFTMEMEERAFDFVLHTHQRKAQYVEEYAKLLLDCIHGDQTLFVSTAEVQMMWRAIDPVVEAWKQGAVPLANYEPDSAAIIKVADNTFSSYRKPDNQKTRQLGVIGLGKMGGNVARRLLELGWAVAGYNRSPDDTKQLELEGLIGAYSLEELVNQLKGPRILWLMLPAGQVIDDILVELRSQLQPGDIIVDAGNSFYKDSIRRARQVQGQRIGYIDVGFSGGPGGARNGASLMIGGDRMTFDQLEPLWRDLARAEGYQFFEGVGAGHFVKMIHNGIEYGMMQAIAEGFAIMNQSSYQLDLKAVAHIYNRGSVIESRLIAWLEQAFMAHGPELAKVSGIVKHTGEGQWTVETAKELGLAAKIIEGALEFRIQSEKNPDFTGKILSALREQFGGH